MSYVPAKLREIFQTCRRRPENIADRGRFRLGDRKSGHPFRPCRPERGAGDANRRGTLRGRRPAVSAGLRGLSLPRKIPFALSFRRKSRRGSRSGNVCRESAVRLAGRSRWIGVFFPSKKAAARNRSVPLPVHPLRMSANVGNRRVCAAADRAAFPGRRADRRTQRRRDGFERCRQPGRVRTRAFSCGSAQRFRLIGKGRAGTVRRVADDADGSFTNGSNRESPATGPASGRGTGWG